MAAVDGTPLTVRGAGFIDRHGRQVTLRGFNVSGTAKLNEYGGLPFASVADARRSAAAMRRLTGANAVRFLIAWAYTEPTPGQLDTAYVRGVTEQLRAFLEQSMYVLVDYHQDLFSRYLFRADSRYTGDGAPQWVVAAGRYPRESCRLCVTWGQNIKQNATVREAMYDFWHNRMLTIPTGEVGMQDAFLRQTEETLRLIRTGLSDDEFSRVLGLDPLNEPYPGRYDSGQDSHAWERDVLLPFYRKVRNRMDAAGWHDKPAFIEPHMFWDANLFFMKEKGGFHGAGRLGRRFVFNTHFYDQKAISGIFMWGKAKDGRYTDNFTLLRQRAAELDTAAFVSEFGNPVSGYTSAKTPTVLKGVYQALDSSVPGAQWWTSADQSGPVLSSTQWQWDIYSGRHREPMNGNLSRVQTDTDAWNGEDFSVVRSDDSGTVWLRIDQRLVDRAYPVAVAGRTIAFTYEDQVRDGSATLTWNRVPDTMPNVARLVADGQYAVLVWRSTGGNAPTELRLPSSLTADNTVVLSDVTTDSRWAGEADQRLVLAAGTSGAIHHVLVTNGTPRPSAGLLAAARRELSGWADALAARVCTTASATTSPRDR